MQRTNQNRIKLLITLVLFILAAISALTASLADARGFNDPGASSRSVTMRPGVDLASGDPDDGQGVKVPNTSNGTKRMVQGRSEAGWDRRGPIDWGYWAGRIWATLYLKAAR